MYYRLFIVAAIVLIIFGIIASASNNMQLFGVWWYTWFMASFLSFLVDVLIGHLGTYGYVTFPGRTTTTVTPPRV